MKKIIKNNYKIIIGILIGILLSLTSVYAIEAYIESNKVSYDNHNATITKKNNVQESLDELYERSGIHKEKWIDKELNGADPVLKDSLIPVEIKPNGDVYYANENSEWYNYSEKRWANSVILNDNVEKDKYTVGSKIDDKDIKGYFVWIPRYQYRVWDLGNYNTTYTPDQLKNEKDEDTAFWKAAGNNSRIIDIKFGTPNDIPKMAEPSTKGVYYTHPAFTLGTKNLNGIWVGKFETGGTSESDMVVKPNMITWRNETVKTFFDASKSFEQTLDSHMMKNTEWGAVAYLSHSKYGIGTEININNASDYMTGYSAAEGTDQSTNPGDSATHDTKATTQPWNTLVGYLASTTGNISGIYDMSGGSWEVMASCVGGNVGNSGFSSIELTQYIDNGYIDEYAVDSGITTYNKRILGDATGETGPFYQYCEGGGSDRYHNSWYGDYSSFIIPGYWFVRSADWLYGSLAGQFSFSRINGGEYAYGTFRLVLSPTFA